MIKNINEEELENVTGGWQFANGGYVNYGNYIVYTVAPGDVLSGIGQRFGVGYMQIAVLSMQWFCSVPPWGLASNDPYRVRANHQFTGGYD